MIGVWVIIWEVGREWSVGVCVVERKFCLGEEEFVSEDENGDGVD